MKTEPKPWDKMTPKERQKAWDDFAEGVRMLGCAFRDMAAAFVSSLQAASPEKLVKPAKSKRERKAGEAPAAKPKRKKGLS
jgi:hypothetical protein